jgi:hypothetical protein
MNLGIECLVTSNFILSSSKKQKARFYGPFEEEGANTSKGICNYLRRENAITCGRKIITVSAFVVNH